MSKLSNDPPLAPTEELPNEEEDILDIVLPIVRFCLMMGGFVVGIWILCRSRNRS